MSDIFLWDCLLPRFLFFLNFLHVPESPFSQRLILIWFAYTFEALKAFHCGQIVSNTVFEDGKRKLCPNVSTIESKKQYFFFNCILWRSRQPWILYKRHISKAILPLKKTERERERPTTESHYSWCKGLECPRGNKNWKRKRFYR